MRTSFQSISAVVMSVGVAFAFGLSGCSKKNPGNTTQNGGKDGATTTLSTGRSAPDSATSPAAHGGAAIVRGSAGAGQGLEAGAAKTSANGVRPTEASPSVVAKLPAPAVPAASCFVITYRHKSASGHADDEACSHHKNLLSLKQSGINPKSVCVRVDGTPVHYQLSPKGLLLGAVAGPQSKITVRYCTGKAHCSENCAIPKDEFMDALGAGSENDENGRSPASAQWDDQQKVADVSAELDSEITRELSDDSDLAVFEGWSAEPEVPVCRS